MLEKLRAVNVERCERPDGFNHPLGSWSFLEWAGAMCGEAGEASNVAKKLIRIRDGIRGNPAGTTDPGLRAKLAKELGDTIIYADLLAAAAGIDLSEAVRTAFNDKSDEIGYTGGRL